MTDRKEFPFLFLGRFLKKVFKAVRERLPAADRQDPDPAAGPHCDSASGQTRLTSDQPEELRTRPESAQVSPEGRQDSEHQSMES